MLKVWDANLFSPTRVICRTPPLYKEKIVLDLLSTRAKKVSLHSSLLLLWMLVGSPCRYRYYWPYGSLTVAMMRRTQPCVCSLENRCMDVDWLRLKCRPREFYLFVWMGENCKLLPWRVSLLKCGLFTRRLVEEKLGIFLRPHEQIKHVKENLLTLSLLS